jgi:hypothetical protein
LGLIVDPKKDVMRVGSTKKAKTCRSRVERFMTKKVMAIAGE